MTWRTPRQRRMRGFTLLELSVILLALGLILPGAIVFWQLSERQSVSAAQASDQQRAHQALWGFMHAHYRLPCPAADAAGLESCTDGAALRQVGYLPWRTLALPAPEAGNLRYGVYRAPHASAPADRDLAALRDRMPPLRVRTPDPRPRNHNAPNPNAPPVPSLVEVPLGPTASGNAAAPLNPACQPADSPPCASSVPPTAQDTVRSAQLLDLCLALHNGAEAAMPRNASGAVTAPAPASLHVRSVVAGAAVLRPVAFVVAAPGLLDADGDGQAFDGLNALASSASPGFEAPGAAASAVNDDQVSAASHAELFAQLHCAAALSSAAHAHFNAATGALVLERALYDYRDQLDVSVQLAKADVAAAAAGVASATAAVLDAAKEMVSATADTTMSAGARAFQIGLAAAGIAAAAVGAGLAAAAQIKAGISLAQAQKVHGDFAARTTAMTELAISVNHNTLLADAIGY